LLYLDASAIAIECLPMADDSGAEKPSTLPDVFVRNKRILWQGGGVVALIALGAAVIWLAHKQVLFSAVCQKAKDWPVPLGLAVVGLIAIIVLWKLPQWQIKRLRGLEPKERFDRVNEARKTLATILGGVVLLAGFFGTWQNLRIAQENLRVSQEGQITDRFTKAIEQLGAVDAEGVKKMVVRLGGIYALERIANESERDHWPIMEVLSTYVRNVAPNRSQQPTRKNQASSKGPNSRAHPEPDIQAILTVLGRRDPKYEKPGQTLDLSETELSGADLIRANLSGAGLSGADLSGAFLSGAYLMWADLHGADLSGAYLSGADLIRANFNGADLSGADLSRAFLAQEQIDHANGNSETRLPFNVHMPESWKGNQPQNRER